MHLIFPQKFCISIVFNFSWDACNSPGEMKNKFSGGGGGEIRGFMGDVQVAYDVWYGE